MKAKKTCNSKQNSVQYSKNYYILLCFPSLTNKQENLIPTPEENRILRLVNDRRPSTTLIQLRPSAELYRSARLHSQNMARQDTLQHQTNAQLERLARNLGYVIIGENIASGFRPTQSAQLVQSWMDSPRHRAIIEGRYFEEAAIAISTRRGHRNRYFTLHCGGKPPELHVRWVSHVQSGAQWTHKVEVLVRDNHDIPMAMRVFVQLHRGTGVTLLRSTGALAQPLAIPFHPMRTDQRRINRSRPIQTYGIKTFYAIQQSTARFTLRFYALDARNNRSGNIDLRSN